jgi:hypothetical protein
MTDEAENMPAICEICERRECVEPWKICGECESKRTECIRSEELLRKQFRVDNAKLIGKTTPGMKGQSGSVHERRGRKLLRPVKHDVFMEGGEDEPE